MTNTRKKKIKALLSRMNKQNERFIPVATPLVEMMDMSVTDRELDYLLKLGTGHLSYAAAAKQSGMASDEFDAFFDTLNRKGLLHRDIDAGGNGQYRLNAIAVGWYEAMMHYLVGKPEIKAFSKKWEEFFQFFARFNFVPLRPLQNMAMKPFFKPAQGVGILSPALASTGKKKKIIPIDASLSAPESKVYPTAYVDNLVREFGGKNAISIFPCVCRRAADVLDKSCSHKMPEDSCMAFGEMAKAWVDFGYGRSIDQEEALSILRAVRDKGAVHTVIHERDDIRLPVLAICNCCWDCCGILKAYNMGAVSLKYESHFLARVKNDANCKGCGLCERFCPTTAVSIEDKIMTLNADKCIGCGQCAYQCPKNNIEMTSKPRTVFLPLLKPSEVRVKV